MKKLLLSSLFALPLIVFAQVPAGDIAQYPLDNDLLDIKGSGFDGSLISTSSTANRFGTANKATGFVAGSSYGQLPGTLQTAISGNFSIGFWFRTTMTAASHTRWFGGNAMIDAEVCGTTSDWGISLINGGKVAFGIGNAFGDVTIISPLNYNDGSWHFVTATRASGTGNMRLYVDGNQVITGTGATGDLIAPSFIGLGNNTCVATSKYTGTLDDIVVYDRQISTIEVQNLYNFSSLTTLPLKWVSFTALEQNNVVALRWKVSQAENVAKFVIEHSANGQNFTDLASIPANIQSDVYSYQHPKPYSVSTNYYRIRQVDHDGNFTYSDLISLRSGQKASMLSVVYNPGSSVVTINNPGRTTIQHVVISDAMGRRIISKQLELAQTIITLNANNLRPGKYFVSLYHDSKTTVLPFLKQ
ncbi:MAG: T9SS type A sorting domain-containing protein [Chitinophagaceae bacterium]|nr:MAG: T9SS type A sorting domain-containing protein [Chitinophagaceae bacterium]